MSHEHAPSHDHDAGFFGRFAQQKLIDEPVHANPCPTNTTACDPKSPSHAELWAHQLDGINIVEDNAVGPALGGPIINNFVPTDRAWKKNLMGTAGLGFSATDFILDHGGQVVLDLAGFVPGLNVATEGAQGLYHAAHWAYDAGEGNTASAHRQEAEAISHTANAGLNAILPEGSMAERVHQIGDTHEAAWDFTSTLVGDDEKLPFFGGIVPWIANGAGREGERR
jgi:hypothetical protein